MELEARECCFRKCFLRESGIIVDMTKDMTMSSEKFQELFPEGQSKTEMSEKWQSVDKQSVAKCESESKIKTFAQL